MCMCVCVCVLFLRNHKDFYFVSTNSTNGRTSIPDQDGSDLTVLQAFPEIG